ncbi:MAG: tRNA preQ1(34) S-adenosylmethionine ribosyltransferase-isomerase QueA, partial [Ignavibacteriae bacterium]
MRRPVDTPEQPSILQLSHYDYDLPSDRIAIRPLEQRDASKLLVYDKTSDTINHQVFTDLSTIL